MQESKVMAVAKPRERLIRRLFDMTDEQIGALEAYAEALSMDELPQDYDPDNDPLVGFLNGPIDLSIKAKNILREEFGMPKKD
jgi:hypothetical protein